MGNGDAAKYPVPVVRLIVTDARGAVLLLRRQEGTQQGGGWCLPGGKVDYGQTAAAAAARELAEETSLECVESRFLFYQDSLPWEAGGMHCINLYFKCETRGAVQLNDESCEYVWVSRETLGQYRIVFGNGDGLLRYWDSLDGTAPRG